MNILITQNREWTFLDTNWLQLKYLYLLYFDLEVLLCFKQNCYPKDQLKMSTLIAVLN